MTNFGAADSEYRYGRGGGLEHDHFEITLENSQGDAFVFYPQPFDAYREHPHHVAQFKQLRTAHCHVIDVPIDISSHSSHRYLC